MKRLIIILVLCTVGCGVHPVSVSTDQQADAPGQCVLTVYRANEQTGHCYNRDSLTWYLKTRQYIIDIIPEAGVYTYMVAVGDSVYMTYYMVCAKRWHTLSMVPMGDTVWSLGK